MTPTAKERERSRGRRRHESRKASGLCRACGKKSVADKTRCDECAARCSELRKQAYRNKCAKGICHRCGKSSKRGKVLCAPCGVKGALYSRRRVSGWTDEHHAAVSVSQNGICALCLKPPKPGQSLFEDHCHTTGKPRGLLCCACNNSLGGYEKFKPIADRVEAYLTQYG